MALTLTLDIGDIIEIEDIKIKYSKKMGRKINISVEAPKTKKIVLIKSESEANLDGRNHLPKHS